MLPEPDLGKNIFALKIFLPEKLKQELQRWADHANITLGQFARALICAHLFGRAYGPSESFTLTDEERTQASTWEEASDDA